MADEHQTAGAEPQAAASAVAAPPKDPKNAIIDALMELAGERSWDDITISDVAARANVSLAAFRDYYPSKGAVLAGFSRRIDHIVLEVAENNEQALKFYRMRNFFKLDAAIFLAKRNSLDEEFLGPRKLRPRQSE